MLQNDQKPNLDAKIVVSYQKGLQKQGQGKIGHTLRFWWGPPNFVHLYVTIKKKAKKLNFRIFDGLPHIKPGGRSKISKSRILSTFSRKILRKTLISLQMCMFWLSFSFCMMVQCCFIIFDQQFSEKKILGPYIDQNLHHSYRLKGPDFAFSQISGFPVTGGSWFGFFQLNVVYGVGQY